MTSKIGGKIRKIKEYVKKRDTFRRHCGGAGKSKRKREQPPKGEDEKEKTHG